MKKKTKVVDMLEWLLARMNTEQGRKKYAKQCTQHSWWENYSIEQEELAS